MIYEERIVEVLGEARGERVMIRSVHADGTERLSAVKWMSLVPLGQQLF
jgi:CMP-2-keto-3-deoxyoctulosonic acid synthetase